MASKEDKLSGEIDHQRQKYPGLESEMDPELLVIRDNYKGSGKLEGKEAIITGGDSGTSFTRSLGSSLAGKKIRVNGVAPGPIWTPLIPATRNDSEKFGKDKPLGRPGQPAEVAPAYVFLASEDASYMTSQIVHINGGEVVGA